MMVRHPRIRMLPIFRAQIQQADCVLFSKTEQLLENERDELVHQFSVDFPGKNCAILRDNEENFISNTFNNLHHSNIPFSNFLLAGPLNKSKYQESSLKIKGSKAIILEKLTLLLNNEPSIVRAKGYIYTGNETTYHPSASSW